MNYSDPYAPTPHPHSEAATFLSLHHPDLPWKKQSQIRRLYTGVEEQVQSMIGLGSTRVINCAPFMHLYQLYRMFCELFIRKSQGFMPRIVALNTLSSDHHAALNALQNDRGVKVVWLEVGLDTINYQELRSVVNANTVLVAAPLQTHFGRRFEAAEITSLIAEIPHDTPLLLDATLTHPSLWPSLLTMVPVLTVDLSFWGSLDVQFMYFRESLVRGYGLDLRHYREAPYPAVLTYRWLKEEPSLIINSALQNLGIARETGILIVTYDGYYATNPTSALVTLGDVNSAKWDSNTLTFAIIINKEIISARTIQEKFLERDAYVHAVARPTKKEEKGLDTEPLLDNFVIITRPCPALALVLSQLLHSEV